MVKLLIFKKIEKPSENHPDFDDYNRTVLENQTFFEFF